MKRIAGRAPSVSSVLEPFDAPRDERLDPLGTPNVE
jgi:hypothetical protein